jgi:uncharacterized protein involved in outer membrane biogenesis
MRRLKKIVVALVLLVMIFALTGFFVIPPLLKHVVVKNLSEKLHRTVALEAVAFNPFTLRLSVKGFVVKERGNAGTFLSFQELLIDLEALSLPKRALIINEIRLVKPYVLVALDKGGIYNFSDLLPGEKPAEAKQKESAPFLFSLNNILIIDGKVDFIDGPKETRHRAEEINIGIPFLSNISYNVSTFVKPSFAARINGSLYALEGRLKPFTTLHETELDIDIRDLNIPYYLAYSPVKFNAKLLNAGLDVKAKLSYRQEKEGAPFLSLAGNVKLKKVALDDLKGKPILRLPLLSVDMADVRPLAGQIRLTKLALDTPELHLRNDEKGVLNLKTLLPTPQQAPPKAEAQKADGSIQKDELKKAEVQKTAVDIDEILIERGRIDFAGAGPRDPFSLGRSNVDLDVKASVSYRQEKEGAPSLSLAGNVKLKNVTLDDLQGNPFLRLSLLSVDMAEVRPLAGQIHLAKIALDAPELHIRRDEKGVLNLKALLSAPQQAPQKVEVQKGDGSIQKDEPKKEEGQKTVVAIDEFLLAKGKVAFADAGPRDPFSLVLSDIGLQASGISTALGREGKASLTLSLPKKGKISLAGPITVEPFSTKLALTLKDLDIPTFQPYLSDVVNIKVTDGKISASGNLLADSVGGSLKTRYSGKVLVSRFASIDAAQANDLLKWEALHFNGIDAGLNPLSVHIREVALSRLFVRILIHADGAVNLQNLTIAKQDAPDKAETAAVGQPEAAAGSAGKTVAAQGQVKPAAVPGEKKAADIKLDAVTLQGGEIDFTDRHIQPSFAGRFVELGGRISGLSSMETTRADVELRGKLDGYAPLEITGRINPLAKNLFADIKAAFKDMDLSPMTPYSGKYVGYTIQKGKLSFDLKYLIDRKKLDSQNNIFIDQFTLGDKVESPQATKLPVSLAISLLKDRSGQIQLDIPVAGTLDDPEFSIWRIVLKVIVNLLTKAATAPFALLGSLFGGGEEMSFVEFDYGSVTLEEANLKKLQPLAKALKERPALKLDVEGYVDAEKDREGIKVSDFQKKLKAQKLREMIRQGKEAPPVEEVVIGAEEYEKVLKAAYDAEKFPKPRDTAGQPKILPPPEMEKLMLTHIEVKDNDLRLLASRRALNVRNALLATGEVTPDRVFLIEVKSLQPEAKEKVKNSRVDFRLK